MLPTESWEGLFKKAVEFERANPRPGVDRSSRIAVRRLKDYCLPHPTRRVNGISEDGSLIEEDACVGIATDSEIFIPNKLRCKLDWYVAIHELGHFVLGDSGTSKKEYLCEYRAEIYSIEMMTFLGHPPSQILIHDMKQNVLLHCRSREQALKHDGTWKLRPEDWVMEACNWCGFKPTFDALDIL